MPAAPILPGLGDIPIRVDKLAMVPGRIPRRRHRRIRGKRVPIKWQKRHGTVPGMVPGFLICMGTIIVHPDVWPALRDQFKAEPTGKLASTVRGSAIQRYPLAELFPIPPMPKSRHPLYPWRSL